MWNWLFKFAFPSTVDLQEIKLNIKIHFSKDGPITFQLGLMHLAFKKKKRKKQKENKTKQNKTKAKERKKIQYKKNSSKLF